MLVSPCRTGMTADRVVGIVPTVLSVVLMLPVLAPVVTAVLLVVLTVLLVVSALSARLLASPRWTAGRLAELPLAGLDLFVATAWGVLLMTLRSRSMCHLLVSVTVSARTVLSSLALLATMGRVGVVLLVVERFVGTVVVSCHCES